MQIAIRHYFSLNHLAAASVLARQSAEIESSASAELWPECNHVNQACAVGALINSVSFLEATINEVFADCAEKTSAHGQLPPNSALLGEMWNLGVPRTASYSVLEKYQMALTLSGKEQLPDGVDPLQSVDALIFARNYLIHFEPEFVLSVGAGEKDKPQRILSRLRGRFALNALAPVGSLFFPDRALGAGSAQWSVRTALSLTDRFFELIGVPATYSHLMAQPPYSYFGNPSK